jgi:hypothetical protein
MRGTFYFLIALSITAASFASAPLAALASNGGPVGP